MTHKVDTVYTAEPYILWESDGDLEQQAEARRALGPRPQKAPGVVTDKAQKGNLMKEYLAYFYYRVFTYDYPSPFSLMIWGTPWLSRPTKGIENTARWEGW